MSISLLNHMSSLIPNMDEESRKELVEAWMNDDLVNRQFNLECPSDEETPIEPVIEKEAEPIVEKKEKKKKTPPKKKTPAEKEKKFDPVKFLKANPDTPIKCIPDNPKKLGTASYNFYEGYKNATTFQEFLDAGGENKHMRYDFRAGFIHIQDDSVVNIVPEQKKNSSPKKPRQKKEAKKPKSAEQKTPKNPKQTPGEKEVENNEEKKEDIGPCGVKDDSDEEVAFKPLCEVTTDEDIEEDDDEWPTRTVDGVEYFFNDSDGILTDKKTAEQIGYLDDDGTIDFIGNGADTHEKNKENL